MAEKLPIFTYGSIRVGESIWQWVRGCVVNHSLDATTPGHLWFAHLGSYPVAKFLPRSQDVIHGDILWCEADHPLFERMINIEFGAGYDLRDIEVTLQDGSRIDALGFHYLYRPSPDLFIPSGDWRKAHREYFAKEDKNAFSNFA